MTHRTRYRIAPLPFFLVSLCLLVIATLVLRPQFGAWLDDQAPMLSMIVMAAASILPSLFFFWYISSFAEIQLQRLRVRSMFGNHSVDLRMITAVDVFPKSTARGKRKQLELIMRLEDINGDEVWLPLNAWRDEDLLVARLLRATVEKRIPIGGEPEHVERFTSLLGRYKSWDRQQVTKVA